MGRCTVKVLDQPSVPHEIALIRPILAHLQPFVQFFASRLGPELDTAFVWGLLGRLLQIIPEEPEALSLIPRMLKAVCYKIETFNGQCHTSESLSDRFMDSCFYIQVHLVDLLTQAIKAIRETDGGVRQKFDEDNPWLLLERRYASVNQEISEHISRMEKLAFAHSASAASRASLLEAEVKATEQKIRCLMLSPTKSSRFFNRVDIFEKLDSVLNRASTGTSFQSVALYGLGGIGKSAIAARYVELKVDSNDLDAVFWVHGEKAASLRQSFTDIAMRLKLPEAHPQNHDENLILVQDWFQSSKSKWLVVYDNVESADLLLPYWPSTSRGRAIITTRNHSLAFRPASAGIEVKSWDPKIGCEILLYLLRKDLGADLELEGESALELSKRLSGHALGISHMAGLIRRRSWSITEFMQYYTKNPKRLHGSELNAIWEFSFRDLVQKNPTSHTLLGILSYLMPDNIPQSLFALDPEVEAPIGCEFCSDEFEFAETMELLLTLALVKRNRDEGVFSIHRMVQTQFKFHLSAEGRQKALDDAVALVYEVFPKENDAEGQQYDQWAECNRYLQHVINLKDCFKEEKKLCKTFKASWKFCELLKECQRYVYEANALDDLKDMCEVNLVAVEMLDDPSRVADLIATIFSHQAQLAESTGEVQEAIELNKKGHEIRLHENPLKWELLAGFECNIGYNYNTANQHETALEWLEKSRGRWYEWCDKEGKEHDWPTHTKTTLARCLIYLDRRQDAYSLLDTIVREFRCSKPFPWAMLAYALFALVTLQRRDKKLEAAEANAHEAQNLWLKGDQSRLHPFNGACMYKIGVLSLDQGKVEAAIKHIRDSIEITKHHTKTMPVEHARNLFKLSEGLLQDSNGNEDEAEDLRDQAEIYLKRRDPDATEFGTEQAYDKYIPIFWR
ncbi:hypothetical protein CC80DRAFT_522601 [Byssothecium circinans]|uniref:Uncharacterized protein n=1 Tax=Byssothecium circinans TaxID=147558 RepID=A0A6A5UB54_9PLEO|nr:hypothetical protein CC80DRAFT_522601 [Byssothecium circinans]